MPTNTLTDAAIRKLKPEEKDTKHFDGGGLHLVVTAKGAKVWRCSYRLEKKPQTATFGPYPLVSLADAREKRDELKKKLLAGENLKQEVRAAKAGKPFKTACEDYWRTRNDLSEDYKANALRALELHLWPALGSRDIASITRDDLLQELKIMDAAGKHVYVRKVRMWASQVWEYAIEHGDATVNPAALINSKRAFGSSKVKNFAALKLSEMPDFMSRLAMEGNLQSALAARLLALTWVRTTELRLMEWHEIEGDLWRIPKERMKRGMEHLVPLSDQAKDVLAILKARNRGGRFVFESDHRLDRTISENTVLALIARMGYKGMMTGHGFRSVASTWANESGFNPDAIERQLAHAPEDDTRAAYLRSAFLPERKEMMQAWADWLDSITEA